MSIIPVIFFALFFGLGSIFSATGETTVPQEASPPVAASASPVVPGTAGSASMPSTMVKSMFDFREALPSCTTWQCLQKAAEQNIDGAELVRVQTTDEGDPIRTYQRVSHGAMEIYTDNSQDSFRGDPAWTFQACLIPDDVRQGCAGS